MGAAYLDGRQVGDDGRYAGPLPPDVRLAFERDAEIRRERSAQVWTDVEAKMRAAAESLARGRRSAPNLRAHRYRDDPGHLPAVADIRFAGWKKMLAIADALEEQALRPFSKIQVVPVTLITAQAVRLYARWLRRFGDRRFAVAAE